MNNFQQYRHIAAPGWSLGWTWAKKEVIWNMVGSQTTEQGDCSKFKGNVPHCCKKDPTVVDFLPGTPYNQQVTNCCKGGVLSSWAQDPTNAVAPFQISVGLLMNYAPNLLDTRGRLLPRSYDVLGLYTTFIVQKPDPDITPPMATPILQDASYNLDE
ncbi:COBRA-like protein, partial [Trifolium pratense]